MSSLQAIIAPTEYALGKEIDGLRGDYGVTVAIPCYAQADTLIRAVESAVNQTVPPDLVLVIDDGTPDTTVLDALDRFSALTSVSVGYRKITNRGLAAARNTALMHTRTFAFLPLDADDWLDPTYIEKTLPLLQEADVVLTGIQEHGPSRNGAYMPGYDRPFTDVTADLILNDYNRFYYCSLFRTDVLKMVGGYNVRMNEGLEDADLWVDLLKRGVRFAAVDEPLFQYTTNPDGMLQTIHRNGGYQRMVEEMRRHHGCP